MIVFDNGKPKRECVPDRPPFGSITDGDWVCGQSCANMTAHKERAVGDELNELYRERAEYADMESSCQDVKKYTRYGGLLWRLFDWLERIAAEGRREVNEDIAEIKSSKAAPPS